MATYTIKMNGHDISVHSTLSEALKALESIVDERTAERCDNYCYYDEDDLKEMTGDFPGAGWYNVIDYTPGNADCLYLRGQREVNLYGTMYEIVED